MRDQVEDLNNSMPAMRDAAVGTKLDQLITLLNQVRAALLNFIANGMLSSPVLVIGSTNTAVAFGQFLYTIDGAVYSKAGNAVGVAPGNDVVPLGKFGAVALDIDAAGTVTAIEAPANATGYNTAPLAVAALPAPASGHARLGTVTASKSNGTFTFGTTALDAANTTVAYTSAAGVLSGIDADAVDELVTL